MTDDAEAAWLAAADHHRIDRGGETYPPLLADAKGAPESLYVKGDAACLSLPALAIVGSRNPTRAGRENAFQFARHLAGTGFAIVSGLAEGIDSAAHEGALAAGGKTIAVLGHGPDRVYPASNRPLADRIAGSGALVSEYRPEIGPRRHHFPERNRIISGLALGTLVVEAARRSGSLITARQAGEQGREVFAIPGSIHNPLSRGCHRLIRDGARLVECADDILSELAPLLGRMLDESSEGDADAGSEQQEMNLDTDYVRLLDAMGFDPISANELARRSALTIGEVSSMLLILELEGEIESLPGGRFSRLRVQK